MTYLDHIDDLDILQYPNDWLAQFQMESQKLMAGGDTSNT